MLHPNLLRHYASLREALTIFKNDPLVHPPGTQMTYSTFGYTLLGVIVEAASGQTYRDLGWIVEGLGTPDGARPGLVWHGGVQQGVTTSPYMLPDDHSVVAVMTNLEGEGLALAHLASEITDIAVGR